MEYFDLFLYLTVWVVVAFIPAVLMTRSVRLFQKSADNVTAVMYNAINSTEILDKTVVKLSKDNLNNLNRAADLIKKDVELSAHELKCSAVTFLNILEIYKSSLDPITDKDVLNQIDRLGYDVRRIAKAQTQEEVAKRLLKYYSNN